MLYGPGGGGSHSKKKTTLPHGRAVTDWLYNEYKATEQEIKLIDKGGCPSLEKDCWPEGKKLLPAGQVPTGHKNCERTL